MGVVRVGVEWMEGDEGKLGARKVSGMHLFRPEEKMAGRADREDSQKTAQRGILPLLIFFQLGNARF